MLKQIKTQCFNVIFDISSHPYCIYLSQVIKAILIGSVYTRSTEIKFSVVQKQNTFVR
jgi:hypothetical protein